MFVRQKSNIALLISALNEDFEDLIRLQGNVED